MLKLKVEGLVCEIEEFAEWLKKMPRIQVNTESKNYANRGANAYSRKYLEIELKTVKEFLEGVT